MRYAKDFDPATPVIENCKYMQALGKIQQLNEAITKLQIEVEVQSYWGPRWEAEHAEVNRLRQILRDNGVDA